MAIERNLVFDKNAGNGNGDSATEGPYLGDDAKAAEEVYSKLDKPIYVAMAEALEEGANVHITDEGVEVDT